MITELGASMERTRKLLEDYNNGDESCGMNFVETESVFAVPCAASDCSTSMEDLVKTQRPHFTDTLTTNTYCESCGSRLRYHRKKWILRGEECPVTLDEVNRRHGYKR